MDEITEFLRESLEGVKNELNSKILQLAKNFNEEITKEIKTVSDTCVGWFNNLKAHIDRNSTQIAEMREEINSLKREFAEEIADLKKTSVKLEADSDYKTDHAFRLQLIAHNIPEAVGNVNEDCFAVIRNFMVNKLKIDQQSVPQLSIRDCHRLGKKDDDKIRPMVVAFLEQPHRDFVLKQAKNLYNTNFGLQPHLSKKQLDIKKILLAKRKDIKTYDKKILAFIGYRAYRPVLLVKVQGKLQQFKDEMTRQSLQYGDLRPVGMD